SRGWYEGVGGVFLLLDGGMAIDSRAVWAHVSLVVFAVTGLLLLKAVVLFAASRTVALPLAIAGEAAILMSQAGEFAFVVIGLASAMNLLPGELAQLALAVVGLSMVATPLLAVVARHIGQQLQHVDHREEMPNDDVAELRDHVIIGGFGRVGQTIGRVLAAERMEFVALDADATLVAEHRKAGSRVFFGDASRAELLQRAGAGGARAFVVTLDSAGAAERM